MIKGVESIIGLEVISKKKDELLKIAEWRNETLESLRTPFKTPVRIENQLKWVDSMDPEKDKYFFIYLKDGTFIGYCGLNNICTINKTAEVSLLIGTPFQGRGYGRKVIKTLLGHAFVFIKLECVYIEVYATTNKFHGFWEKLGFIEEGILRKRKFWDNIYYNSHMASILREEYINFCNIDK